MTDEKNNKAAESEEQTAFREFNSKPWPDQMAEMPVISGGKEYVSYKTANDRYEHAFREAFRAAKALWQKQYDDGSLAAPDVPVQYHVEMHSAGSRWLLPIVGVSCLPGHVRLTVDDVRPQRSGNGPDPLGAAIRATTPPAEPDNMRHRSITGEHLNERLESASRANRACVNELEDTVQKSLSGLSHRIDLVTADIFKRLDMLEKQRVSPLEKDLDNLAEHWKGTARVVDLLKFNAGTGDAKSILFTQEMFDNLCERIEGLENRPSLDTSDLARALGRIAELEKAQKTLEAWQKHTTERLDEHGKYWASLERRVVLQGRQLHSIRGVFQDGASSLGGD